MTDRFEAVRRHLGAPALTTDPFRTIDALAETLRRYSVTLGAIANHASFEQLPAGIRAEVRSALADRFLDGAALIRENAGAARDQAHRTFAALNDLVGQ